jgi:NAD(P)-dependent dehydrogenase (short-subunit alcohol dehydrogenase family)
MSELSPVTGKTALVTGGARGIGRMIARGLCEAGANVFITSRRADACRTAAEELRAVGRCEALPADLVREDELRAACAELSGRAGALHLLVHAAGVHVDAPFESHPASAWDAAWSLHVKAFFLLLQELAPLLERSSSAEDPARAIALGSSDALHVPAMDVYAYAASKAALHFLVRDLARPLGKRHITVNAIAPGAFPTDMLVAARERFGDGVERAIPLRRLGSAEHAVGAVLYLASRAGAYVTGAVLPVDGGLSC